MRSRIDVLLSFALTLAIPFTGSAQTSTPTGSQLLKMEFSVDGQPVGKVTNIKGITNQLETLIKSQTQTVTSPVNHTITITVIPTKADYLKQWFAAVKAKAPSTRRTATLIGVNGTGATVVAWSFTSAEPVKFAVSGTSTVPTETIVLSFAQFERTK